MPILCNRQLHCDIGHFMEMSLCRDHHIDGHASKPYNYIFPQIIFFFTDLSV